VALLRDVKYLEQQDSPDRELPSSAANVFQQSETYRQYLQNLDVVVALYNSVRDTILDVEYPLIEHQLEDIDKQLEKAIAEINWTSSGVCIEYLQLAEICSMLTALGGWGWGGGG
jgi:dynein heavy chain